VAWVVAPAVFAVLLVALALWARVAAGDRAAEADRLHQAAARADAEAKQLVEPAGNEALADPELTRQVIDDVTTAVQTTFSYDHTNLDATEAAVEQYLTGTARCVYEALFAEVERLAPEQKIVLATTVREVAVVRLAGDRAEALVYVDQQSTRADTNKTTAAGGQLVVRVHRDGDRWTVAELDLLGQPVANGEPAPRC
jgi:Mce-associated membrane protein